MSQRDFMTATSRISFSAAILSARGGQYAALAQINQLAEELESLVTYPPVDKPTPYSSPMLDDGMPFWGSFDAVQTPSPQRSAQASGLRPNYYFDAPHTLDAPPPHPSRHDQVRTDRPLMTVYPARNPREGFDARKATYHAGPPPRADRASK